MCSRFIEMRRETLRNQLKSPFIDRASEFDRASLRTVGEQRSHRIEIVFVVLVMPANHLQQQLKVSPQVQ